MSRLEVILIFLMVLVVLFGSVIIIVRHNILMAKLEGKDLSNKNKLYQFTYKWFLNHTLKQ